MLQRAGLLDERVTFQAVTEVQDDMGEPDNVWTDLTSRWASIEPLAGREMADTHQVRGEADYSVVVRRDGVTATLTPKHRMKMGSRIFDIAHALNAGSREREIELLVTEVV